MEIMKYYMLVMLITTYSFGMETVLFQEGQEAQLALNARLHNAVERNDFNVVYGLFQGAKKPDVNAFKDGNTTPIHTACRLWLKEIARLLLKHGADINRENKDGLKGLRLAIDALAKVSGKDVPFIKELVRRGAGTKDVDREMRTHLHIAALYDDVGLLKLFLRLGVDPLARDSSGRTFLHVAMQGYSDDVLELLESEHKYAGLAKYDELKKQRDNHNKLPFDYGNGNPRTLKVMPITIVAVENDSDEEWSSSSGYITGEDGETSELEANESSDNDEYYSSPGEEDDLKDFCIIDGGVHKQKAVPHEI